MLSISMAYDVISCKKNPKKKMLTFLCRFCSQAKKLPKISKKNFALIVITIFVFIDIILCINYIYHYQCNNYYWSEIVFRGCAEAMYKHDYGCDREMQVLAVIIRPFFEIIRDNLFCNLSSFTANNLLFYICSQSQLLIKEEIQSK